MDGDKTPEVPEEAKTKEDVQKEAPEGKNPFGENIKPAMYILFDQKKDMFFVMGAPGFLDDPVRAYGALRIAEKNLDEFYSEKKTISNSLKAGVKNFQNKLNMRNFLHGRR